MNNDEDITWKIVKGILITKILTGELNLHEIKDEKRINFYKRLGIDLNGIIEQRLTEIKNKK